jgi:ATP-dependent DNA helicase RecQ
MQEYMDNDQVCRSRQLLRYFGEENAHDCDRCDVCLSHRPDTSQPDLHQQLLALLSDRRQHPIAELYNLPYPTPEIEKVLIALINEEAIVDDDGLLSIP